MDALSEGEVRRCEVWIADDDEGVRASLTLLLGSVGLHTRTFPTGDALVEAISDRCSPCVILLDLRMPGIGGLGVLRALRSTAADVPTLVLSGTADVRSAVLAMKAGARDVLLKPAEPALLLAKVVGLSGEARAQHAIAEQARASAAALRSLSDRERQVVASVLAGRDTKQIAAELQLSVRTIETYRAAAMRRLGVEHVASLVRVCLVAGFDGAAADGAAAADG